MSSPDSALQTAARRFFEEHSMSTSLSVTPERIERCYRRAVSALLNERNSAGHWSGQLSTSPLSTATAVMALEMVRRDGSAAHRLASPVELQIMIERGLNWLSGHQNDDGGWGDTTKSLSNISTTMLAYAVFHAASRDLRYRRTVEAAEDYIDRAGGVKAVVERYGKDKTFSVPILTQSALAGLVDWRDVQPLPFELAWLPHRFYKTVRLPVVSYALPALIAIGQIRNRSCPPCNPLTRLIRQWARPSTLRKLEQIQPANGGFLEATPLTSFVTMSLAGMGLADHPVARRGLSFLLNSVRPDGSWPIDTNLATWVTTLSVNALGNDLPEADCAKVRDWLLGQQYQRIHPYTNADPGGWAWTDLPGGVPDVDDTAGAILALLKLGPAPYEQAHGPAGNEARSPAADKAGGSHSRALALAVRWLLDVQNSDGGWPTFCRGWGRLPFDRSAPDLTAHALRALVAWIRNPALKSAEPRYRRRAARAVDRGFAYLAKSQGADGSWRPLWFGNQFAADEANPTYGTARVLAAFRGTGRLNGRPARHGIEWLVRAQNSDGGWGGAPGIESSVEETALAVDVLASAAPHSESTISGVGWLLGRIGEGSDGDPAPIGFYFAKLWYFERLYPRIFTVAALRNARRNARAFRGGAQARRGRRDLQEQAVVD